MKHIITLLLVLLFASCGKQDVFVFEENFTGETTFSFPQKSQSGLSLGKYNSKPKEYPVQFTDKLKVRFKLIEEDNLCIFEIERNSTCKLIGQQLDNRKIKSRIGRLKFYDKDNFLLFETFIDSGIEAFNKKDVQEFFYEKKTRYVTRSLLEEVDSIKFDTTISESLF